MIHYYPDGSKQLERLYNDDELNGFQQSCSLQAADIETSYWTHQWSAMKVSLLMPLKSARLALVLLNQYLSRAPLYKSSAYE